MCKRAIAEFAKGLLTYVEDGNVLELRDVGFVKELQEAVRAGGLDKEENPDDASGEGDEDVVGDWTLTLRYTDTPRSEVEHTAEDCTKNGDYPADSCEIDLG